jgi:hypothetical protein
VLSSGSEEPVTGCHKLEQIQVTCCGHPAVLRDRDLIAVLRQAADTRDLHVASPDLVEVRADKAKWKFAADQHSVESKARHACSDRVLGKGQQRRSNQSRVRLGHRRCRVRQERA